MAKKPTERVVHLDGQLSLVDTPVTEAVVPAVDATSEPVVTPAAEPEVPAFSGPNTRVRAGNAMERARAAALTGAREALAERGVRALTMVDVADKAGLARATLYNHVRDKESLLELLLRSELDACERMLASGTDIASTLAVTAGYLAGHPALVGIRRVEPQALTPLAAPAEGALWDAARAAIAQGLTRNARIPSGTDVDLVLRWLCSVVVAPAAPEALGAQARALAGTVDRHAAH